MPLLNSEVAAKLLNVLNEVMCGIVLDLIPGLGFTCSSLIEKNDAIDGWVEEAGVGKVCLSARAPVKKDDCSAYQYGAKYRILHTSLTSSAIYWVSRRASHPGRAYLVVRL